MFKVIATSKIDNWSHESNHKTMELANEWIDSQESTPMKWSRFFGARRILKSELPETHISLVLSEEDVIEQEAYEKPIYVLGTDGNPILEEYTYYDLDNNLQTGTRPMIESYETVPATYVTYVNLDKEYTITIEDITAEYESDLELAELISAGQNDENCCKDVIRLIGGYNKQRNLTLAQIQQMLSSFAPLNECLKNNMPGTAKMLMNGITPDGIIVTQELIDKCNIIFTKYGIV